MIRGAIILVQELDANYPGTGSKSSKTTCLAYMILLATSL